MQQELTRILPSLQTTSVNVRPKSELGVSGCSDPQTIVVGDNGAKRNLRFGLVGGREEVKKPALGCDDVGMSSSRGLGFAVVELEDLDLLGRET